jgi:hypothetical protein
MTAILAASYDNPGDITPGALGFIVVAALAIAVVFLFRSMNKHLRKVASARDDGRELGAQADAGDPGDPAGTAAPTAAASKDPNGSASS